MALFGRESAADHRRAEQVKRWVQVRSPYAVFSLLLGILAVLDAITGILGLLFGVTAWVLGVLGLRHLRREPTLLGRRLCLTGMILGALGVVLSVLIWIYLY